MLYNAYIQCTITWHLNTYSPYAYCVDKISKSWWLYGVYRSIIFHTAIHLLLVVCTTYIPHTTKSWKITSDHIERHLEMKMFPIRTNKWGNIDILEPGESTWCHHWTSLFLILLPFFLRPPTFYMISFHGWFVRIHSTFISIE